MVTSLPVLPKKQNRSTILVIFQPFDRSVRCLIGLALRLYFNSDWSAGTRVPEVDGVRKFCDAVICEIELRIPDELVRERAAMVRAR